jgi:predicted outer membrane repeat protein
MFLGKQSFRAFSAWLVVCLFAAVMPLQTVHAAGVLYVIPNGTGNCSDWDHACDLRTALTGAISGDEIWVAAGTYKPTAETDRTISFFLKSGVAIYGGFARTEIARSQRDPLTNLTILSGDIDSNDTANPATDASQIVGSNSYHVLTGSGTDSSAILDGFTITAGSADDSSYPMNVGGGLFNGWMPDGGAGVNAGNPGLNSIIFSGNSAGAGAGIFNSGNPALSNINFLGNYATNGSGIYNDASSPTLTNVIFNGNTATDSGGGMYNGRSSNPVLADVTFSSNTAGWGGGIFNDNSSPALTNVIFTSNAVTSYGGGMQNQSGSNPVLTHVKFNVNSASSGGGGMNNYASSPVLTNVTFAGNTTSSGGGMYNGNSSNPGLTDVTFSANTATWGGGIYSDNSSPLLTNVTFSGNSAANYGGGIENVASSPTLTNITFNINSAGSGGGGIMNVSSSSPQIRNTILWGNTAGTKAQVDNYDAGSAPVINDSVVQDGCPAGSHCTNVSSADPFLGSLGNYGGFNQTIPILPGSSAIDKGADAVCPASDQRGVNRPQGHCDSGAFQWDNLFTAHVYFAKPAATGAGDCQSWANACGLQTAINLAQFGNEIWAGEGTYKPTTGSDRSATFLLKPYVSIYGGFAGTETARSQRDPAQYVTILSGDIGAPGNASDNSYHVVTGAYEAILDGFTITAGNANGSSPNERGGGVLYDLEHYATSGTVIYRYIPVTHSPTLTNIILTNNSTTGMGGGVFTNYPLILTNANFSNNTAASGGGVYDTAIAMVSAYTNVSFSGNNANYGGGMDLWNSFPDLQNVTFSANTAVNQGGGMELEHGASAVITNGTFSANSAASGGGMYVTTLSWPHIHNSIFWGNTASSSPQLFYSNAGGGSYSVFSSVIQDGCPASTTCIDTTSADPLLGTFGSHGGIAQTIPLLAGSSAIDMGDDIVCPATDARGVARPQGARCDIGAYEYNDASLIDVYYVKSVASGTGNCQSWGNACTLQTALAAATLPTDVIWLAAGTYKPTTGTDRSLSFQLKNYISLYGGFAGTETGLDQRDPALHVTILSGDIGAPGDAADNSYNVVTGATGAILDGVTITGGHADDGDASITCPNDCGGGLYNPGNHQTVRNVILTENFANDGGGMFNASSGQLLLADVTFSGNSAAAGGGGMFNLSGDWYIYPILRNVSFIDNTAPQGGGMYNYTSDSILTNVTFSGNPATGSGGGMYNYSSSPTLTNVTFSGNTAASGGGIMNTSSSSSYIRNTILWGNTASDPANAQIANDSNSNAYVSYSVVQGGYTGSTNIITADPLLGSLGKNGGYTQTIPILEGSSAIDAGNNSVCPATDQRGMPRPQGVSCDIGAYEREYIDTTAPTVNQFTTVSISNSLNIPVTAFAATDDVAVTGYLITTNSTQPAAAAPGWTASAPGAFTVVSDGSYTLYPWAKDAAGHVSGLFASPPAVVVDTTPPDTLIDSYPANPTNKTSASFIFSSSDSSAIFECSLDAGAYVACTSPKDYTGLPAGAHTFSVRATDPAGNVDPTPATYTWTIGLTAPSIISILRANPSPTHATSVQFSVTFSEPVIGVDVSDFSLATTGVSGASITGVSGAGSAYVVSVNTGSGAGTIRLDALAGATITDLAGNTVSNLPYSGGETYNIEEGPKVNYIFLPLIIR